MPYNTTPFFIVYTLIIHNVKQKVVPIPIGQAVCRKSVVGVSLQLSFRAADFLCLSVDRTFLQTALYRPAGELESYLLFCGFPVGFVSGFYQSFHLDFPADSSRHFALFFEDTFRLFDAMVYGDLEKRFAIPLAQ